MDMQTVPGQFVGFFDDAATFPPGLAPLEKAITDHVARRANRHSGAVGPAVLALRDLPEARAIASRLELDGRPVEVSAVVPADGLSEALELAGRLGPELEVVALELKTTPEDPERWRAQILQAKELSRLPVYVELDAAQMAAGALDLMAGSALHLKYRTGGIRAELFPTPEQLASVLLKAVEAGLKFKLTAGLHEAVRYTDLDTGFTHHGFLNIAMATEAARQGAGVEQVTALLSEFDTAKLERLARSSGGDWRQSFASFGTCSVVEPAESLEAMDLFPHGMA
ncbi:hypothetical protein [Arthrobacter sp. AQ5-05]|uniref:hypothetical protein n=1 Tax=Arthrobacter sp. AQ5-05 TaxID=2184581 RepID=UPI0025709A1C|nr:hypothetical protein [Arthrobacter sp. AQ5-05]